MFKQKSLYIVISVLTLGYINITLGTTLKELTLKELTNQSTDVFLAKVKSIESYKGKDFNRFYSNIELEILDVIKGKLQKTSIIKIRLFGGTINGITMRAVGMPIYKKDEETLLFFKERIDGVTKNYDCIGLYQGKYDIVKNSQDNKLAIRHQTQNPLQLEKAGPKIDLNLKKPMLLDEFIVQIKNYL